ncbi:hypothetical protein RRG08_035366 [Elysia crispata]|uniref:Uncharacterized protein n=1 Tax=Elysia crispata TaxID=231223 RepID=A0AAE0Y3X3_9GAST|nr:hypothetical protein RRG08_035366 [Elysia crispata]
MQSMMTIKASQSTSTSRVSSFLSVPASPRNKRPKFVDQYIADARYSLKSLPSTTRLDVVSRRHHDGFVRVFSSRHGPTGKQQAQYDHTKQKKSFIFGETRYLKSKLGFCMPSVRQTLATEHQMQSVRGSHGFQKTTKQRLNIIQQLISERAAASAHNKFLRQSISQSRPSQRVLTPTSQKSPKKGTLESQQYIILLDANTRRAKQIDEKIKFAVAQEVCRLDSQQKALEKEGQFDSNIAKETRDQIEKSKEKERRKSKARKVRKSIKMLMRKSNSSTITSIASV